MSKTEEARDGEVDDAGDFREWFARHLGVRDERKKEIYVDISRSATLRDASYWLQIIFAAGIATLGLVLNSPAVIIGAMLISPLMGPILAAGLALAAGDLILGLRAVMALALSCLVAVLFAVLLVGLLPFKDMTAEIAARTQPTTLDLVVALFSGAIGSIAICKEVKGVVTSIPGVAIAVALMPPLCVAGYGIGLALSLNSAEGLRVARGGGLLFLTNLVAITFTAMIVFLALHIDTKAVKERIEEWRATDGESQWLRNALGRFVTLDKLRSIGSLPARFLMIILIIISILFPLTESFNQLKRQITEQHEENRIRQQATDLWQLQFGKMKNGEARSFVDQLTFSRSKEKLAVFARVFTAKPCTAAERVDYSRLLAERLNRPTESVSLQLVEIPTATGELEVKAQEEKPVETPPTITQLQESFLRAVETEIEGLRLPPSANLLSYNIISSPAGSMTVALTYFSDRDIDPDAQSLIVEDVRARLDFPTASVRLERVPASFGEIVFERNQSALPESSKAFLDRLGFLLNQFPKLQSVITVGSERREQESIAEDRAKAIREYMASNAGIDAGRMTVTVSSEQNRTAQLTLSLSNTPQ